jgi:hypothetical protein
MKQLTLITLLLTAIFSAQGQDKDTIKNNWFSRNSFTLQQPTNYNIYFYGKNMAQGQILRIDSAGDAYILPSAFCSCESCRNYKGMKWFANIITGQVNPMRDSEITDTSEKKIFGGFDQTIIATPVPSYRYASCPL